MKIGVAFGWHSLPFEALLAVTRRAEQLGYHAVFVDGDVSVIDSLGDGEVLDGHTVTTALLARTQRIEVNSLRLVHHWNAARLAQATATLWRLHPGRVRLFVSIGGQPGDLRFGLGPRQTSDRIAWLDETLEAVRRLWRGEATSCQGRFVRLERARVRPAPGEAVPIHVAGRGPRLLGVVARHADAWDVNLPAVVTRVEDAIDALDRACREIGRDPASIPRSQWIFTRPHRDPEDPSVHEEFERLNPWFAGLAPSERREAIVAGPPGECLDRIAHFAERVGLDLPVIDLSGVGPEQAESALEALGPMKTLIDSDS